MAEQFLKTKPTQETKRQNVLVQNVHLQGAGLTEWLAVLNSYLLRVRGTSSAGPLRSSEARGRC